MAEVVLASTSFPSFSRIILVPETPLDPSFAYPTISKDCPNEKPINKKVNMLNNKVFMPIIWGKNR